MLNPSKGIALFTDGSSYTKDKSGGWAWCAIDCFGAEEIGTGAVGDTTNNRMEMQAWFEGLNYLSENYGACEVLVYSDSEYVGFGAMNIRRQRKRNRDLWWKIDDAIDQHTMVEFVHVKGHGDSHYNCLVDELAGNARKSYVKHLG